VHLKPLHHFIVICAFLLTGYTTLSQEKAPTQNNDSVQYVTPSQQNADLGLMVPPPCFLPSTAFNGYLCTGNGAAIMMHQISNISYLQATKGMNEEFYSKKGFTYISSFDLRSDNGVKGKVYKLGFKNNNQEYIRYTIFAGSLDLTLWFNITYPKVVDELMEFELLKAFQTITLNPKDNAKDK
jgi:hypothetical protein